MQKQLSFNVIVITLDSCRWDSFYQANTTFIESCCHPKKAFAQATFTYAAHLAMFQGIFPQTKEPIPYYNRYTKQLIRIKNRPTKVPHLVGFPFGTHNIVSGFRSLGYYTIGLGAMEWFKHIDLTSPFEDFFYTGIFANKQIEVFLEQIHVNVRRPFFGLINFGETHHPYKFNNNARILPTVPVKAHPKSKKIEFNDNEWTMQIKCCEYLDEKIKELITCLNGLQRNTIVIICGDHGECFGDDGFIGHGFYHPKIMEVPLAIFETKGDLLIDDTH